MKRNLVSALLLLSVITISAQDPQFLNTSQSLLNLNPSFAGSNGGIRNQTVYRNNFFRLTGGGRSYFNAFDANLGPSNGAIFGTFVSQSSPGGEYWSQAANFGYAYQLQTSNQKLKITPSLQMGAILQHRLMSKASDFNAGGGLLINYSNFYAGIAVFNVFQPQLITYPGSQIDRRYNIHASYNMSFCENSLLNINASYSRQGTFNMVQLGLNTIIHKRIIAGLGGRGNDAAYVNAGYRGDRFMIQFTYDRIFSKLSYNSIDSYEIGLSLNFRKDKKGRVMSFEGM